VIGETGSPRLQFPTLERGADELERCLERGRALGLIEVFERPNALPTYRVPRLLAGLVVLSGDEEVLAKVGAEVLYQLWLQSGSVISEEQMIEVHRLSLLGKSENIATNICLFLSSIYNQTSNFNQTLSLCKKTLILTNNERHKILLEQGNAYESLGLFAEAFNSYQSAKLVAKENKDKNIEGKVAGNLGVYYYNRGQLREAINNCTDALKIALDFNSEDEQEILRLNALLGVIWITQGNTEKSFNYYQEALKIAQKTKKFISSEASCYCNLCDYYGIVGDSEIAIDYGKKALRIQETINDLEGQASVLHGLAEVFIMEERYKEAISCVKQAMEIAQKVENPKLCSETYSAYAYANLHLNRLDEAWKAAITAEKYDYPPNSYYILMLLGLIALKQNQTKTAYDYIIRMLKNVKQTLSSMQVFSFKILDAQFIAICCLILMTSTNNSEDYIAKATNTYKKARNLNQSQGTLKRIQQLFLILRSIDTENRLTSLSVILFSNL
jgi:tetratricopeptide (TPR) repeat protein